MTRGLVDTAFWNEIAPYIRLESYAADRSNETGKPRVRIELSASCPMHLRDLAVRFETGCVYCGRAINPFRPRQGNVAHVFVAVTCPLDVTKGCARSQSARDEYVRIRAIVEKQPPTKTQGALF